MVSAASAWEIATKVRLGKLPGAEYFEHNFLDKIEEAGYLLLAINVHCSLRAGRLIGDHLHPFDRILAAQALAEDIAILSAAPEFDTSVSLACGKQALRCTCIQYPPSNTLRSILPSLPMLDSAASRPSPFPVLLILLAASCAALPTHAQAPPTPPLPGASQLTLTSARALSLAHPKDLAAHLQYSAALLEAGIGEQAQAEARLASTLDPSSAAAFTQLGLALEHNSIGIKFGSGFDRQGALTALLTAQTLAPASPSQTTGPNNICIAPLAQLYVYDPLGQPYTPAASLPDAIREFRRLKAADPTAFAPCQDDLLLAMLHQRQFANVLAELAPLPPTPNHDALALAALGASQSVAAARDRASRILDLRQRSAALRLAALQLMRLGFYARSADLLDDSLPTPPDHSQTPAQTTAQSEQDTLVATQVQILRYLQQPRDTLLPATDPRTPVETLLRSIALATPTLHYNEIISRHSFASDHEWQRALDRNLLINPVLFIAQHAQLPVSVTRDVLLSNATLTAEGDDTHGYVVHLTTLGLPPQPFFVSLDEGKYKIVSDLNGAAQSGNYALYLVEAKRLPEARALLDWRRALLNPAIPDDPLAGDLFARLWPLPNTAPPPADEAGALQLAAFTLTLASSVSQSPLAPALAAYAKASDNTNLIQLLAVAHLLHQDAAATRPLIDKLLAKYPDSPTALLLMGQYFLLRGDNQAWAQLLGNRLLKHPADPNLLRQSVLQAEAAGDFPQARKTLQRILDLPSPDPKTTSKPSPADLNNLAWLSLFPPPLTPPDLPHAQQAVALTNSSLFGTLHTLACLQAAQGDPVTARQTLLQAMASANLVLPDASTWFALASIDQQLGDPEAAIAAYQHIPKPDTVPIDPTDVWVLAQARLSALQPNESVTPPWVPRP